MIVQRKNALIVAHKASMIYSFLLPYAKLLISLGYDVYAACDFVDMGSIDSSACVRLKRELANNGIRYFQVDFPRNPFHLTRTAKALKQLKRIFKTVHFDIVHCHTPVGGVLTRLAAIKYRRTGTKVIYTAHGFHFYKGAPLKNWLLYYPVEWLCSFWTDTLITINREDYALAKKHMHARRVVYVPGVGINMEGFRSDNLSQNEKQAKRESLGVENGEKMFLSVGELSVRKNHEVIIKALALLPELKYKYFIAGVGALEDHLLKLIRENGLNDKVKLLGFRTDVAALNDIADLFIFPSLQEGLPVALMEAVANKTPVVCSAIRGNVELVTERSLFAPHSVEQAKERIEAYLCGELDAEPQINLENLKAFSLPEVIGQMKELYITQ